MSKQTYRSWFYNTVPLLIWLLLLTMPFVSFPADIPGPNRHRITFIIVIFNTILLFIFYLHTYLLYPLLQMRKRAAYFTLLFGLLTCYWLCLWLFRDLHLPAFRPPGGAPMPANGLPPLKNGPGLFVPVFPPFIVLLCSFCYRIILDNQARLQTLKEQETVHLRTELNFLRSQINPHFLFNVLNNLTSLARKRSDQLETAIVNLSQLMRYMLYESDDNLVPLDKELAYLTSYIELQLLRFGSEITVNVKFEGDYSNLHIGPMLLISLVENAFKHGTGGKTTILINLKLVENNKGLCFCVKNDITQTGNAEETTRGIGLKNLKRRLDILYSGRHMLEIVDNGQTFSAQLNISL